LGFKIPAGSNVESFYDVTRRNKRKNVINKSFFISFRKHGFRSSMFASERAKLTEMKAQMEQQIQSLEEQIYLEEIKLLARNNKPQQPFKASR